MQTFIRALLSIYLGHLLTDFVFQTPSLVSLKRDGKFRGYFIHSATHFLATLLLTGFFVRGSALELRTYLILLALTIVHTSLDLAKIQLTRRGIVPDGTRAYLGDQATHALTVVLAAWLLVPGFSYREVAALAGASRNLPAKFLAVPIVYIGVIFGGGYLIRYLTRTLAEGIKRNAADKSSQQLQNAGLYIGWLERFLVITSLMLHSPATIGLILTAKSIARYPEFKSEHFAEYFLIGTLLSIAIAILGGMVLVRAIFGAIRLA
ncbi:MAG: DUF3307 domain-containing protein [Acidobacteria bacterium]|nr:DUF3307 domain-containing protein [Acidobacteriota bacterium]MBS1866264.1 DUF3307 domain-containing protein [Acidobacteriota bacterium]